MIKKMGALLCGLMSSFCSPVGAITYKYTALVITEHINKKEYQVYFKMGKTTNIFDGFKGKAKENELIENAKTQITQELTTLKKNNLYLVFEKLDAPQKRATLIFYSTIFEQGETSKSSWMKINDITNKNEIYFGNINISTKLRSRQGSITQGLYDYLTKNNILQKAAENAKNKKYLDLKTETGTSAPDEWIHKDTKQVILFYKKNLITLKGQSQDYFEFTNTYSHKMIIPDETGFDTSTNKYVVWRGTEDYFQAMKFANSIEVFKKELSKVDLGALQKTVNSKSFPYKPEDPTTWRQGKNVTTMLHALRAKFSQDGECIDSSQSDDQKLRTLLLSTGDKILVEDSGAGSANDKIWGAGNDYKGFNYLGQLLMHVRNEIRSGKAYIFKPADGPQLYLGVSITPDPNAPQWYLERLAKLTPSGILKEGPSKTQPLPSLNELTQALKALSVGKTEALHA